MMYDYYSAQAQYIINNAIRNIYQQELASQDFRASLAYNTQYNCCDAYHLRNQPEAIRCCVLGVGSGGIY